MSTSMSVEEQIGALWNHPSFVDRAVCAAYEDAIYRLAIDADGSTSVLWSTAQERKIKLVTRFGDPAGQDSSGVSTGQQFKIRIIADNLAAKVSLKGLADDANTADGATGTGNGEFVERISNQEIVLRTKASTTDIDITLTCPSQPTADQEAHFDFQVEDALAPLPVVAFSLQIKHTFEAP
jgi:hypothetical protein